MYQRCHLSAYDSISKFLARSLPRVLGWVVAFALLTSSALSQPTNGQGSPPLRQPPTAMPSTGQQPAPLPRGNAAPAATPQAAPIPSVTRAQTSSDQTVAAIKGVADTINRKFKDSESGFIGWITDIKLADLPMILFTGLLVVVGFRQEAITTRQSEIMNTALEIQRHAESYVEDSTAIARNASMLSSRAYVYISRLSLAPIEPGATENTHRLIANLSLKNFGNTPSLQRVSVWWSEPVDSPPPPTRDPDSTSFYFRSSMFGAGEILDMSVGTRDLSDDDLKRIRYGAAKMYFITYVEYEDIYGNQRKTAVTSRIRERLDFFVAVEGAQYNVRT